MSSLLTHGSNASLTLPSANRTVAYAFDYRQPLLLLYLLYTIPSFIAYHRCRQFLTKESVSSSHFNNVALFIIDFLFTRLPISGLLVNLPEYIPEGIPLTIIFFLSYYLIYANFFSITLICINRMSSVVFPYSCVTFWQRFVWPAIVLIYILPLLTTWQMFTYSPYFLALYEQRSAYQLVYRTSVLIGWLALIIIYTGSETSVRATCQDLRAFALDIAICCPPWILYYTTVHTHKTTIGTSSVVHSGAAAPTKMMT
uniref:Serpentine receptor class gamma n=1 Tax=Caenorhabditis tropicalis TaxID=1561998 RepID=A0A1I7UUT6_9PELO